MVCWIKWRSRWKILVEMIQCSAFNSSRRDDGLAHRNRSNTLLRPCSQPAGPSHCKDKGMSIVLLVDEVFSQLSLLPDSFAFPGGIGPNLSRPPWAVPTSLPRSQSSFVLLSMQDETEEVIAEPVDIVCWIWLASWIVPRLGLFGAPFFALLHFWHLVQSLGCGPTVGHPRNSTAPRSIEKAGRAAPPPGVTVQVPQNYNSNPT